MKLSSKLIAKLLTLCGISLTCTACYAPGHMNYVDFTVRGVVVDEETGDPVEGIKVVLKHSETSEYIADETLSDTEGAYALRGTHPSSGFNVWVTAEDVDGEAGGGEFATRTRKLWFAETDFTGGERPGSGDTHLGSAERNASLVLSHKTEEEPVEEPEPDETPEENEN